MPAAVVIVQQDKLFLEQLASEFRRDGHGVAAFTDPATFVEAIDAPGAIGIVKVLITSMLFEAGEPHGVNGLSLGSMLTRRHPGAHVVFTASSEFAELAAKLGEFVPFPTTSRRVLDIVNGLLSAPPPLTDC